MNARFHRWAVATHAALSPLNGLLINSVRGLAQLDLDLIRIDMEIENLAVESLEPFDIRRMTLSRLWVLGGYELVRTVTELLQVAADEESSPPTIRQASEAILPRARAVKALFERVRVPLAKFETAHRFPGDSPFAQPGLTPARMVGWWVDDAEFIERRALGDALLEFLEAVAVSFGHCPPFEPQIE